MQKILIVDTGGTFNKIYNPITGELCVDTESKAIRTLAQQWRCELEPVSIIGKDSLEMTSQDRLELLATVHQSEYDKILIVHGTDTMDITALYLNDAELEKRIVLTGAMVPFSIDPVEATANFASAMGALSVSDEKGVFIAMNGVVDRFDKIIKNRTEGKFVYAS